MEACSTGMLGEMDKKIEDLNVATELCNFKGVTESDVKGVTESDVKGVAEKSDNDVAEHIIAIEDKTETSVQGEDEDSGSLVQYVDEEEHARDMEAYFLEMASHGEEIKWWSKEPTPRFVERPRGSFYLPLTKPWLDY